MNVDSAVKATQTFIVDLERLERQGADANLAIRLMRAADDIALAHWGLRHFTGKQPRMEATSNSAHAAISSGFNADIWLRQ